VQTATIAATDLRRRIRNRSAVVTAVVGPLALAVVFGILIGGAEGARFTIGVVDDDRSPVSEALVDGLTDGEAEEGAVSIQAMGSTTEARRLVDDGDLDAAIVVPGGFAAAATSGGTATLTVLRSPDRAVSGQVAEAVATEIASGFRRADVAVRTVVTATGSPPGDALIAEATAAPPAVTTTPARAGAHRVSAGAFYGAAMSILFLFFTVGFAPRSLIDDRRNGTLARVLATPTRPSEAIAGKVISVGVLALGGFVTVWAVTSIGFGARWGPPVGVLIVMVAMVLAACGVSMFVAGLARTPNQVDSLTAMVTFALALLGGNFVGPDAPETLERLALLTPNGWALRAFTDLSAGVSGWTGVLPAAGVLLLFAVGFGVAGAVRLHRGLFA
jgi:ABC-2 type transport system permease protein